MELVAGLTWDKQLKRLKERFGVGDLDGIVDVLATLVDADARRPLNHSQRMLRDKAEEAFVTEIGASLGSDRRPGHGARAGDPRVARGPRRRGSRTADIDGDERVRRPCHRPRRRPTSPRAWRAARWPSSISASSTSGTPAACRRPATSRSSASPRTRRLIAARHPVAFICRAGVRAGMVAQAFRAVGFDAYNVAGGFTAWHEQGLPTEPDGAVVADH